MEGPSKPGYIRLTVDVAKDRLKEFHDLYEIFNSPEAKREHDNRLRHPLNALKEMVRIAQVDTDSSRPIARFLASVYRGSRLPFDLRELRAYSDINFEYALAVLRFTRSTANQDQKAIDKLELTVTNRIIKPWGLEREAALHAATRLAIFLQLMETEGLAARVLEWRDQQQYGS